MKHGNERDKNNNANYLGLLHLFDTPDKQHQLMGIHMRVIEDISYHDIPKLHKSHKLLPITQKL